MNRNTRSPYQHHPQSCQLQTTLRRSRNATKTQGVKSPRGVVVGVHVASSLGTSHSASTMTLSETQIPSMDLHGVKKRSRDGAAPAVPVNPSSSSLLSDTVRGPLPLAPAIFAAHCVPFSAERSRQRTSCVHSIRHGTLVLWTSHRPTDAPSATTSAPHESSSVLQRACTVKDLPDRSPIPGR
jgi:hypothetical protein